MLHVLTTNTMCCHVTTNEMRRCDTKLMHCVFYSVEKYTSLPLMH